MRRLLPLALITLTACSAGPADTGPRIDPALREELLTLESRDQSARATPDSATRSEADAANLARFRQIVEQHGWPSRDVVGSDACSAAATLALHADSDPAFQRRCLDLMQGAAARREVSPIDLAYLTDRVLINEGKPQIYGTQLAPSGDQLIPAPVDDPDHLNQRRAAVGLPPMDEYLRRIRSAIAEAKASPTAPR